MAEAQAEANNNFTAQHPTLLLEVTQRPPREAAELLAQFPADVVSDVLLRLQRHLWHSNRVWSHSRVHAQYGHPVHIFVAIGTC